MKAVRFHQYGNADVLTYEEAEQPVPAAGQVLVRVAGTSFNPVDAKIRAGYLQQVFAVPLPYTPGIDLAGTIAELGTDVDGWKVGDAVVASLPMTAGASAEFVVAPADILVAAPRTIDLVDAAALPVAAVTAWQALFEHAGLTAGQSVLVNGGGGAVGAYAVQFAKQAGAIVTATASPRSADRIRGYGADQLVDYTATPVTAVDGKFDVVLNLVMTGPQETVDLVGLVAADGIYVSITSPAPEDASVRAVSVFLHDDTAKLAEIVGQVDAGELTVYVADRRPLAELAAVHAADEAGKLPGKTVLTV